MTTSIFPIPEGYSLAVICSRRMDNYHLRHTLKGFAPRTNAALLEAIDDRTICTVVAMEPHTGKAEDITEYCARQYLYDRDGAGVGIKITDEWLLPLYVRSSIAWANWKDDLMAEVRVTAPEVAHA